MRTPPRSTFLCDVPLAFTVPATVKMLDLAVTRDGTFPVGDNASGRLFRGVRK